MRLVFMGTPEFAVPALRALAERHEIACVYTKPDSASSRGSRAVPSAVKEAATDLGLAVVQPRTLKEASESAALVALRPDAVVVVAYGLLLPRDILAAPRLGAINLHASLLPRWRGAAPIQRAILAGDRTTGVSVMRMEEGLDTGPFCLQIEVPIAGKYFDDLSSELAEKGAEALVQALPLIESGECQWTEQVEQEVTYAEKIVKEEIVLGPELTAQEAWRRVRASSPQAPSRILVGQKGATVLRAFALDDISRPGQVSVRDDGVALGFSEGTMVVTRLKPEGKREMDAVDWARGQRLAGVDWTRP